MKKIGIGLVVITVSFLGLIIQNVVASKATNRNQVEILVTDQNTPLAQNQLLD